ncbi:fibronectin type III domain-containing protein [Alicyclobacillaceae bacterium I2511]|nr:fibronectin type III domain-containing protein [Alicyclobacillaceae bacterium I2511]
MVKKYWNRKLWRLPTFILGALAVTAIAAGESTVAQAATITTYGIKPPYTGGPYFAQEPNGQSYVKTPDGNPILSVTITPAMSLVGGWVYWYNASGQEIEQTSEIILQGTFTAPASAYYFAFEDTTPTQIEWYWLSNISTSGGSFTIPEPATLPDNGPLGTTLAPVITTAPPGAPAGLVVSSLKSESALLSWSNITSASDYNVFLNGTKVGTTAETSYSLTFLKPSTSYNVTVAAVNGSGTGPQSGPISFTTPALPILSPPSQIIVSGTSGGAGVISWTPASNAPSGTTYTVTANGQPVGTTTGSSLTVPNYDPNAVYSVTASSPGYSVSPPANTPGIGHFTLPFGSGDLLSTVGSLMSLLGGFLLLALVFIIGPRIIQWLLNIVRSRSPKKQSNVWDKPLQGTLSSYPAMDPTLNIDKLSTGYADKSQLGRQVPTHDYLGATKFSSPSRAQSLLPKGGLVDFRNFTMKTRKSENLTSPQGEIISNVTTAVRSSRPLEYRE